ILVNAETGSTDRPGARKPASPYPGQKVTLRRAHLQPCPQGGRALDVAEPLHLVEQLCVGLDRRDIRVLLDPEEWPVFRRPARIAGHDSLCAHLLERSVYSCKKTVALVLRQLIPRLFEPGRPELVHGLCHGPPPPSVPPSPV